VGERPRFQSGIDETDCRSSRIIARGLGRLVHRDERDLVESCLAGNQDACAALVDQYARMVGTVIWRATGDAGVIEDLAQETFLRVFKALPYFDARAKLSTWIYTIAHRVAIDHLRTAGRWREEPLDADGDDVRSSATEPVDSGLDPEAALSRDEAARLVRAALAELPDKYRVPLVYASIDGIDYPTIAAMLNVPIGTVKTLIFRAKRLLRERLATRTRPVR